MTAISLKNLGRLPISDKSPGGSNVRYEAIFDILQTEIDKMSSPAASGKVEWQKIMETSAEILSSHSKDMLVGSYLCASLTHLNKNKEFIEALTGYKEMLENFWENLFPKRIKARISAVEWLVEKVSPAFEQGGAFEELSKRQATKTQNIFEAIQDALSEYPDEGRVDFGPVLKPLKNLSKKKEKTPAKEVDHYSQDKVEAATETDASTRVHEAKNLGASLQNLKKIAKFLREADLSDRRSYKLARVAAWELVDASPPNNDGKTQIPSPKNFIDFEKLNEDKDWLKLLTDAEAKLYDSAHTFYLDIHRHVATALRELGEKYKQAYETVCFETLAFINRLPGIENLKFSDGGPFADNRTIWWINNELKSAFSMGGERGGTSGLRPLKINSDRTVDEILSKAVKMANNRDQAPKIIRMIQRRINMVVSSKSKMRLRIGLNKLLSGDKDFEPLLLANNEIILSGVEEFKLEQWDREAALEALISVHRFYKSLKGKKHKAMADEVLRRIGRFDLVSAANNI